MASSAACPVRAPRCGRGAPGLAAEPRATHAALLLSSPCRPPRSAPFIIHAMRFFLGADLLERAPDACVAVVVAQGVQHNHAAEGVRARLDAAIAAAKERLRGRAV